MSESKDPSDGAEPDDGLDRETAYGIPDRFDPVELADQVNELTGGDDLPYYLEKKRGRIRTPTTATEKICELMRELREDMLSIEIAAALDYGKTTVSTHLRGECRHWNPDQGINYDAAARQPRTKEVTDETKALANRGANAKNIYHTYSDGKPSCGATTPENEYKVWDMEEAEVWKKPCKVCLPEKDDLRPEAQDDG